MTAQERFFQVRITREIAVVVQVSAATAEQASARALLRIPAVGHSWEIKRTRAQIVNVSLDQAQ